MEEARRGAAGPDREQPAGDEWAGMQRETGGQSLFSLAQALREQEAWDKRAAAAISLGRLGEQAVGPLIEALNDSHPRVRLAVQEGLHQIGEPAVLPLALLLCAQAQPEKLPRGAVLRALGTIGSPAVPVLLAAWHQRSGGDRQADEALAEALGSTRDGRAIGALLEAVQDRDRHVRRRSVEALGRIGDSSSATGLVECATGLVECLADPIEAVRQAASAALNDIGSPSVPALVDGLRHRYHRPRRLAAALLGRIADVRGIEPLILALDEPAGELRPAAAAALGEFASRHPTTGLLAALAPLLRLAVQDRAGFYSRIFNQIRETVAALCDLPVPAKPPSPSGDDLPRVSVAAPDRVRIFRANGVSDPDPQNP